MAETSWLSRSELKQLKRMGWDLQKKATRPPKIPVEQQIPVDERLEDLTVDVRDWV